MTGGPEILVQKFGGTSVATAQDLGRVAGIVSRACHTARSVVIVVSARGNTTNELIGLANTVSAAPPTRELDQLLATGEVASAALLAMALDDIGIPAVSLDGRQAGITVRGRPGQGVVTAIDTRRIRQLLADGKVVVVAGFQGVNHKGDVVTLGRGGSDTTAVALTAALGQYHCHIYTDVDGLYSCDPRIVPSARRLAMVGHPEVAELAFAGAKVLHDRAGGLAVANDIELSISSSFTVGPGTTVSRDRGRIQVESEVVAVSLDADVAKVSIGGADLADRVLTALASDCVPLDLFSWQRDRVVFTVRREFIGALRANGAEPASGAGPASGITITEDVAKASVVGRGLLSSAEFLTRVVRALRAVGLPADTLCAGQHRISALIPTDRGVAATEALHSEFALDRATNP